MPFIWKYLEIENTKADTSAADKKYPLWANLLNTQTGEIERVDDYDYWLKNHDHLKSIYTVDYVYDEANREEIMNTIRWSGYLTGSFNEAQLRASGGWQTYFRVVADPMHHHVTRWLNEDVRNSMTYKFEEIYPKKK